MTDIGQDHFEEINKITAGSNYGWPYREGKDRNGLDPSFDDTLPESNREGYINTYVPLPDTDCRGLHFKYPVAYYSHQQENPRGGNAIAGGAIYPGTDIHQLFGKFIFGDLVTGRVFAADLAELKTINLDSRTSSASLEEIQLYIDENDMQRDVDLQPEYYATPGRVDMRIWADSRTVYLMSKWDGKIRHFVSDSPYPTSEPSEPSGSGSIHRTHLLSSPFYLLSLLAYITGNL